MHTKQTTPEGTMKIIVLERVDPKANVFRFYVLSIEPTLFHEVSLVREWGRIGRAGRRRIDLYGSAATAKVDLETWIAKKLGRGYSVCAGTPENPDDPHTSV